MDALLYVGLGNAVLATLLAVVVAIVTRIVRRPALAHALWLLVLLKLVTPPLVPLRLAWPISPDAKDDRKQKSIPATTSDEAPEVVVGWIESSRPTECSPHTPCAEPPHAERAGYITPVGLEDSTHPTDPTDSARPTDAAAPSIPWQASVVSLWLIGALSWWSVAGWRTARFRRLLRHARRAPAALQEHARRLANRLGLRACPDILLVPAPISPLLWSLSATPRLLLPAALLERLTAHQRDTLLVHELAHLRRGDHWMRRLEFVVLGLYWWLPTAWWARRRLQDAEEQCCDAWVVWALPDATRAYAEALVETVAFLSRPCRALPACASGIGHVPLLKRRLTMILNATAPRRLSWAGRLAMLVLAAALLPLLPLRGDPVLAAQEDDAPQPKQPLGEDQVQPKQPTFQDAAQPKQPTSGARSRPKSVDRNPEMSTRPPLNREQMNLAEQAAEAANEVELLKAQVEIKQAQVNAVKARIKSRADTLRVMERQHEAGTLTNAAYLKASEEVQEQQAQLPVKEAELKESAIRLRQAQRRLDRLQARLPVRNRDREKTTGTKQQGPASPTRLGDMEKKLDTLLKEVESLRRELRKNPGPASKLISIEGASYVNNLDFQIPFALGTGQHEKIKQLKLFVSTDEGRTWSQAASAGPSAKHFDYHATQDGEHWFAVMSVARDGGAEPPNVRGLKPSVKVHVVTKPPVIRLTGQSKDDSFTVEWRLAGVHVDLLTLKLQYRYGDAVAWTDESINQRAYGKARLPFDGKGPLHVRVSVKDLAGNLGESWLDAKGNMN